MKGKRELSARSRFAARQPYLPMPTEGRAKAPEDQQESDETNLAEGLDEHVVRGERAMAQLTAQESGIAVVVDSAMSPDGLIERPAEVTNADAGNRIIKRHSQPGLPELDARTLGPFGRVMRAAGSGTAVDDRRHPVPVGLWCEREAHGTQARESGQCGNLPLRLQPRAGPDGHHSDEGTATSG